MITTRQRIQRGNAGRCGSDVGLTGLLLSRAVCVIGYSSAVAGGRAGGRTAYFGLVRRGRTARLEADFLDCLVDAERAVRDLDRLREATTGGRLP